MVISITYNLSSITIWDVFFSSAHPRCQAAGTRQRPGSCEGLYGSIDGKEMVISARKQGENMGKSDIYIYIYTYYINIHIYISIYI